MMLPCWRLLGSLAAAQEADQAQAQAGEGHGGGLRNGVEGSQVGALKVERAGFDELAGERVDECGSTVNRVPATIGRGDAHNRIGGVGVEERGNQLAGVDRVDRQACAAVLTSIMIVL